MKHFCTLVMTRAIALFQIMSGKSRVSLQGTVAIRNSQLHGFESKCIKSMKNAQHGSFSTCKFEWISILIFDDM